MNVDQAKKTLFFHAGLLESQDMNRRELVATWRPYSGVDEESFADVIHAVLILFDELSGQPAVDRDVVFSLWWICDRAKVFVLDPNCPVRRDKKVDESSLKRLGGWVDALEVLSLRTLQGLPRPVCFSRVIQYIVAMPPKDIELYRFLLPVIDESLSHDDQDVVDEARGAARVLGLSS